MEELSKGMDKFVVTRSFLEAINRVNFTPLGQRILFTLISRVHAKQDTQFKMHQITYAEMNQRLGTDYKNIPLEVSKALDSLHVNLKVYDPVADKTIRSGLIDSEDYHGEGKVELWLNPRLSPYMLQIHDLFQHLHANVDFCLSAQSIVMKGYLLLKSRRVNDPAVTSNSWDVTLENFAVLLGLGKSYYTSAKLKKKAILPIVEGMNKDDNCDLHVEWKWLKETRTVVGIRFTLSTKTPSKKKEVARRKQHKKETKFEASKLKVWFMENLGYTEEHYKVLSDRVTRYIDENNYTSCRLFLEKFKWWEQVQKDNISLRTFLTYITGLDIDTNAIESVLHTIYNEERDGRAKQGAMVTKLKEALKIRGRNVGKELADLQQNLPLILPS